MDENKTVNEHALTDVAASAMRGTMWKFLARYSGQSLGFLSTIVLARLLLQEDFGLAGYALLTTGFLEVIRGLGIASSVVYLRDEDERRDTAFVASVVIGVLLYGLTWAAAPAVSAFFHEPRVTGMVRVLALYFPIASFANVHGALLDKRLAFRRRVLPDVGRGLAKALTAIVLAYMGFGAWSIVWGQIAGTLAQTLLLWVALPWRPRLRVRGSYVGSLLSYGARYSLVDGLGVLLLNVDNLMIGRFMDATALGVYTIAFRLPELVVKQFADIVGVVLFPVFARLQADERALRVAYLTTLRYVSLVTMPMAIGLTLVADPLVATVFGERWSGAAPVLRAIALYTLLRALSYGAGSVYKGTGRPGLLSTIAIVQLVVTVPVLWWLIARFGTIEAVGWGQMGLAMLATVANFVIAGRVIGMGFVPQVRAVIPSVAGAGAMVPIVLVSLHYTAPWPDSLALATAILSGALAYLAAMLVISRQDLKRGTKLLVRAMRGGAA